MAQGSQTKNDADQTEGVGGVVPGPEVANTGTPDEPERDDDGFIAQPTINRQNAKGPFLVGLSDIGTSRRVTRADFASVGIDQDTLEFDWLKGFKLPLEGINPAAVEYLVNNEYGFSVTDE